MQRSAAAAEETVSLESPEIREFKGPALSQKLKSIPTAQLYSRLKRQAGEVLSAPPEDLKWLKLPKMKSLASSKAALLSARSRIQSIYDDAINEPTPPTPPAEDLKPDEVADELLARSTAIRKSIYGTQDHRIDLYTAETRRKAAVANGDPHPIEAVFLEQAKVVGFIVFASALRELPNGNFYAMPEGYGTSNGLCNNELFWNEPCITPGGIGTAFLVEKQHVLTAGHCVPANIDADSLRVVFGYALYSEVLPSAIAFRKEDVYQFTVAQSNASQDWALLKLDHVHPGTPLKLGSGAPAENVEVYAYGYPSALPLKVSPVGKVQRKLNGSKQFLASVDAFGGNSGSPVLNKTTHEVEGILISGNDDFRFISAGQCSRSVIINQAHAGETICSISVVPKP